MADISAWSPVDESNTASPPNGWPENMQCSGINNSARAMMGAIRRNYDSVTAQFAALPGLYLPITGGTVTGNLSVVGTITGNAVNSNGNIGAAGTITGTAINSNGNIGAAGALTVSGNIAAGGTISGGALSVSGNIAAGGTVIVGGANFVASSGDIVNIYDRGGVNITLYAGAATNYYDNGSHIMRSRGAGTAYFIANAGGTYNQTGSWSTISDDRLKTNVARYTAGLEQIRRLAPVSFNYKAGPFQSNNTIYGLLASEVMPVLPEMVGEIDLEKDGKVQTLSPTHLVYVLLNACKQLAAQNDALNARVVVLEREKK
jgi:hypothetical protein